MFALGDRKRGMDDGWTNGRNELSVPLFRFLAFSLLHIWFSLSHALRCPLRPQRITVSLLKL